MIVEALQNDVAKEPVSFDDVERSSAPIVGLIAGRGGAGASVTAAALARAAVDSRHECVLVDADPLGGGADLLLGAEDEPGLRWPDLSAARGRLPPGVLIAGLPVIDGVHVVCWDRRDPNPVGIEAFQAVVQSAACEVDLVVLDIPRSVDPVSIAALSRCDLVVLVVPAEVRATASALRVAATASRLCSDVRVLVRGPGPSGLPLIAVSDAIGLPVVGRLKSEPGLATALDRGEPPGLRHRGSLAAVCRGLLRLIDELRSR